MTVTVNLNGNKVYKFPKEATARLIGVSILIEYQGEILLLAPAITIISIFKEE